MAEMIPPKLWDPDVKSEGERKTFDALRDGLPDRWQVYHSASWVVRDPVDGALDGEIDFVLCHPDEGVIVLEVKGGSLDCHYGKWSTTNRGEQVQIKDPFQQALDHRYDLGRYLQGQGLAEADRWLIVQAVGLPDVTVHELALAPDAPRELLIDRNDLRDPDAAIERVLAYHRGAREKRNAPGESGARSLRTLLAPEVRLRVLLADRVTEEEEELILLTYEQANLLAKMSMNNRLAVIGCAGSGKTVLAVEHAKRLADQGARVLFVCFNKGLAKHLQARERHSGVEFRTFHELCESKAKEAKLTLTKHGPGDPPQTYWSEELPEALLEAYDELGSQYDALFVDEAQDLKQDWYETLLLFLHDEHKADIWLFFDDNQRIFGDGISPPEGFTKYPLTVNCRNTQAIHREALKYYRGAIEPDIKGPVGREIERCRVQDQPAAVAAIVARLCDEEELPPEDIVVLSAHGEKKSCLYNEWAGGYELTRKRGEHGKVFFSSIRGFKGLESRVVILCELEAVDPATRRQQLYVATSRARNDCVIVEQEPVTARDSADDRPASGVKVQG